MSRTHRASTLKEQWHPVGQRELRASIESLHSAEKESVLTSAKRVARRKKKNVKAQVKGEQKGSELYHGPLRDSGIGGGEEASDLSRGGGVRGRVILRAFILRELGSSLY